LGGYKWVKETKQPHKKIKVDWFWGVYIPIYPPSLRPWLQVWWCIECWLCGDTCPMFDA